MKKRQFNSLLITGGCGFIGTNFIRYLFEESDFEGRIINLDALTYAGNPLNLQDIEAQFGGERYFFHHGSITDASLLNMIFLKYSIDAVVHFAAESHVDRSILGPAAFMETNVMGTFTLLETCRSHWQDRRDALFHHVSTDEVYGSLGATGYFYEHTAYDPRSPYSASKAASDHLVMAYGHTYQLPVTLSNCSNNYGPYQFPEKLIPLMILNMLQEKPLPVYGDGLQIRDWLHVEDHSRALWMILREGVLGEKYNVGGENEWQNIELVHRLCELVAESMGKADKAYYKRLITHVKDRPAHDRRYAINCDKIKGELGWVQEFDFEQGLSQTIEWYLSHQKWVQQVVSGEYRSWIARNYEGR